MIAAISLFLPAVLLVSVRELLNSKRHSKFYIIFEYLISILLINFVAIGVVVVFFNYSWDIAEYLRQSCGFALRYMALSIAIAVAVPALEKLFFSDIRFKVKYIPLTKNRHVVLNISLCIYTLVLFLGNAVRALDNVFWLDEAYSIRLAKMSLPQMISTTAADVHPPLYYMLLQAFYRLFGDFGPVYHSASLLAYGILLLVSILWIKREFGIGATTLFITFASLLHNALEFNLEVRMYSMAELFVLLSFFTLYLIFKERKTRWYVLFSLFSLSAAYTHYYALLSVSFFYIALLLYTFYRKQKKELWKVFFTYLATILGYLPWFFTFLETWKRTSSEWWLSAAPTWKECVEYLFSGRLSQFLWIVLIMVTLLIFLRKIQLFQVKKKEERTWDITINCAGILHIDEEMAWIISGILAIAGTILVGIAASSIFRPVFQVKYLLPVSPVAWLLLSAECSKLKFRRIWLTILIAAALVTGVSELYSFYQYEEFFDKRTGETLKIAGELGEDPYVIYAPAYMMDYYYSDVRQKSATWTLPDLREYADQNLWLFWTEELDDNTLNELKTEGYDLKLVQEGYLGVTQVYIYHMSSY